VASQILYEALFERQSSIVCKNPKQRLSCYFVIVCSNQTFHKTKGGITLLLLFLFLLVVFFRVRNAIKIFEIFCFIFFSCLVLCFSLDTNTPRKL
jgi:hypothetical protein